MILGVGIENCSLGREKLWVYNWEGYKERERERERCKRFSYHHLLEHSVQRASIIVSIIIIMNIIEYRKWGDSLNCTERSIGYDHHEVSSWTFQVSFWLSHQLGREFPTLCTPLWLHEFSLKGSLFTSCWWTSTVLTSVFAYISLLSVI